MDGVESGGWRGEEALDVDQRPGDGCGRLMECAAGGHDCSLGNGPRGRDSWWQGVRDSSRYAAINQFGCTKQPKNEDIPKAEDISIQSPVLAWVQSHGKCETSPRRVLIHIVRVVYECGSL